LVVSLLDALTGGIAVAHKILSNGKMEGTVMFEHCIGADGYGPLYAAPVPLLAVIDQKQTQVRTRAGVLTASSANIQFLNPADIAAATPGDGRIRDIDLITLPDGSKGPILSAGGYVNGMTGFAVAPEVWVG
jgi:hypothetical protein